MGHLYELADDITPRIFNRAVPGPVRSLRAIVLPGGSLSLQWCAPRGAAVSFYRVERTREGRVYESVLETKNETCFIKAAPLGEPWFYRVTAVNARGAGNFKKVYLFQRTSERRSRVMPVAVVPGLRIHIWELIRD